MEDIAAAFEWYADWAEGRSPLYERLARGVADDPALLDIASGAQEGQPPPQLLLAAVHALLLEGREHPLAAQYPTVANGDEKSGTRNGDPFSNFRRFCLANEARLREIVAARRVQTNAVGRSAVLYPSFQHVARRRHTSSLALVEVGASAGLNLCWDRFRYEYDGRVVGNPDSPVCLRTELRGPSAPPLAETPPDVGHRIGIDLDPLDPDDPDDARWLRALIIPEQEERFSRLDAAIRTVSADPPPVIEGDALEVLPSVLADAPEDATLCVFSTHTLYQLEAEEIEELEAILAEHGRERPIFWLSNDPNADADHRVYRLVSLHDGNRDETTLAEFTSYGEWVRWMASDQP